MSFITVVNHVLPSIQPSNEERDHLSRVVFKVRGLLDEAIVKAGVRPEVVVGGSYARGTFLTGAHDVDFFIRFNDEEEMRAFPNIVLSVFPKAVVVKGSRDYFKAMIDGFELEFVPTLKLSDPSMADNSMDASYFHIEYINARLNDYLRNEVLLLKQFCKACGVYGAESYINGFSGYIIELLIIHFGGFKEFLEFIDSSTSHLFIDMEGFYDSVSKAVTALKVVKKNTPLIIVDPVLPTRNAAAGLSKQSFDQFVLQARLFLRSPAKRFFKVKPLTLIGLRERSIDRGHHLFTHKFEVGVKRDVFFAKLGKQLKGIVKVLSSEGFRVFDHGFLVDGTAFIELINSSCALTKRVIGPPVNIEPSHFDKFVDKKSVFGPYVFEGRVCFDVKREYTRAKPLIDRLFRSIVL